MKKLFNLILCLTLLLAGIFSVNAEVLYADQSGESSLEQETYKLGDLNNDGKHGAVDYALVKREVIVANVLTDSQRDAADINGDGRISGLDYVFIKRSVLGLYNIEQPQTPPDETLLAEMTYGYYEYKREELPEWSTFTVDDAILFNYRLYGGYGDGNAYVVFGMIRGWGYFDAEIDIVVGNRTITLRDGNEPLVWDGSKMYDIWTAYENGIIDDIDLEDFQARDCLG